AAITGSTIDGSQSDYEDITIKNKIISKTGALENKDGGYTGNAIWHIDVNSNQVDLTALNDQLDKAYVVDPLASYLEPLKNQDGSWAMQVWQTNPDASGQLQLGAALTQAEVQQHLTYDTAKRELRFELPDPNGSYRLELITMITSDTINTIVNNAYFEGITSEIITSEQKIPYQYAEGGAWAKLAGKIIVTKQDADNGKKLAGAQFKLYQVTTDSNGQTISTLKYSKTTDKQGQIHFTRLPSGTYLLEEVTPPVGYQLNQENKQTIVIDTTDPAQKVITKTVTNAQLTRAIQILKTDTAGKA
ncbi:MAG: prealbumin-like fold domain-containing protein, partial [Clostridiales bacterium]